MATEKEWTLPDITSPDLKGMIESFRVTVSEDKRQPSFAKCLLSAIQCNEIVEQINQLSQKAIVLRRNVPSEVGYTTTGSVYVLEVEVICTQGTLKVNEKNAAKKEDFFRPTSKNVLKVIWIESKSVNVVDAKLTVFMEYEVYLKEETIYIHHSLESAQDVFRFTAYKQVKSLGTVVESISKNVPIDGLGKILQEANDKVLSKDSIKELCYGILLKDKDGNIGTTAHASYSCRSMFTVRRLKEQLVDETLKKTAEALGSEICSGILNHIESKIKTKLEQHFSNLKFQIPDELFAKITVAVVTNVVTFFFPLIGVIFAVGTLVVTFVWPIDVNSREWRGKVADEIYETIDKNKNDIMRKIRPQVEQMCRQTVQELMAVSRTINDLIHCIGHTEQDALVIEWKKRDVFKNREILKSNPSVLTYLAGTRTGVPVVKVFLTGDDKENTELQLRKHYPEVPFEFVDVDKGRGDILENIETPEKSAPEIDNETRIEVNKVIKRNAETVFTNHSSIIGIEIGSVEKNEQTDPCIVLLCLDETILPFGESPLPIKIDNYPCTYRREFVTFGHSVDCKTLNIGCSIGLQSVKSAGSVGFIVRSNDSQGFLKSGFLTAAHVAIEHCDELYEHSSLLSNHPLGKVSHEIVHPSYADNATNVVIGNVIESFFGNYGPNGTGIDAAFVQTNELKLTEKIQLADETNLVFNGSMTVKKRGRTTGDTTGQLVGDCLYVRVYSTQVHGRYYEFENCFAVKQMDNTKPFFQKGDSGSGVFVIDKKDNNSLKPLGVAFASYFSKTAVCKIGEITDAFNVSVYDYEELMDTT